MSLSNNRLTALATFASKHLGVLNAAPVAASSDASFRSYWRVWRDSRSWIVMDAPPDKEDTGPFIDIALRLRAAGLNAPEIVAQDREQGFLLLSDLGTRTYLPELDESQVESLYGDALSALLKMQTAVETDGLPVYDATRLLTEMQLFQTWFLSRHLGIECGTRDQELVQACMQVLQNSALEQPCAFAHRDYHSRNLMVVPGANPGIIDFQDAVLGPVTYDLVSLLKDCYIQWPAARVNAWSESFRQRLVEANICQADSGVWQRWFDHMGLQRHLKVLGIFARLNYRDGKAAYLNDLPLVLNYTLTACAQYPELAAFGEWVRGITDGVDLQTPRPPTRMQA